MICNILFIRYFSLIYSFTEDSCELRVNHIFTLQFVTEAVGNTPGPSLDQQQTKDQQDQIIPDEPYQFMTCETEDIGTEQPDSGVVGKEISEIDEFTEDISELDAEEANRKVLSY